MDAQQFRIGNFVEYKGKVYPLHGVTTEYPFLDTIEFGVKVIEWKDIQPIPLTEQWLLDFGFEKGIGSTAFRIGSFAVIIWAEQITVEYKNIELKTVDFVHEVQNTFWCLTGQELTLKTK